MFDLPLLQFSKHVHNGTGQWLEEAIATSGLLAAIWGCRAHPASVTAFAVAAYIITGAYRFSSTTTTPRSNRSNGSPIPMRLSPPSDAGTKR
jgi:hypothetical protein